MATGPMNVDFNPLTLSFDVDDDLLDHLAKNLFTVIVGGLSCLPE
jgi:hypothetical protein